MFNIFDELQVAMFIHTEIKITFQSCYCKTLLTLVSITIYNYILFYYLVLLLSLKIKIYIIIIMTKTRISWNQKTNQSQ